MKYVVLLRDGNMFPLVFPSNTPLATTETLVNLGCISGGAVNIAPSEQNEEDVTAEVRKDVQLSRLGLTPNEGDKALLEFVLNNQDV
jgi:hypothetical protein